MALAWNLVIPMASMAALIALAGRCPVQRAAHGVQGEDRNPKAIDDLSIMLSDITMEA
jgi:hypothetical protein